MTKARFSLLQSLYTLNCKLSCALSPEGKTHTSKSFSYNQTELGNNSGINYIPQKSLSTDKADVVFLLRRICHFLINDLVHGCLLVPGAGHDVLVVGGDVAREDGALLLGLKDRGTVRSFPGIQQIVFPS